MNRSSRFAAAVSTLSVAAVLSGCAGGQITRESVFGSKVDHANIGLATRAQAALEAEQFATAIQLAEEAVEHTPNDAGFRALLGNCYFAAGRFASAEQAYRDSLSLIPLQPKLILKLALVQIGQGKNAEALAVLDQAQRALDPADYGLAVALAGRPDAAVAVLSDAARMTGADARVRQNLALAYGLSGDWTMARTVAAQDVAPDKLDSRIQQWMAMATPAHPSDQLAALTGIHPAADPGQPQRLALTDAPKTEQFAQLVLPQAMAQPKVEAAAPVEVPAAPPPALPDPSPADSDSDLGTEIAVRSLIAPEPVEAAAPVTEAPAAMPVRELPTRFDSPVEVAKVVAASSPVAAKPRSNAVVQLGAYSKRGSVEAAWEKFSKRFPSLGDYRPVSATFDSSKGTVYRLAVKGFADLGEARELCSSLRSKGTSCFVRLDAGDSPVRFASR